MKTIILISIILLTSCVENLTTEDVKNINNCYKIGGFIRITPHSAPTVRCLFKK